MTPWPDDKHQLDPFEKAKFRLAPAMIRGRLPVAEMESNGP